MMDLSSFIISLLTSFIIFILLMLFFFFLSRKSANAVIYYPNRILKGLEPDPYTGSAPTTRHPLSWIKEALFTSETDIINFSGVDSAVYFVFLSTALGILVISGIILLPILLPIALTDHKVTINDTSKPYFDKLDYLSMVHIRRRSGRLWAYLMAMYWVSLVTYYMLWKAYNHVSDLRAQALTSPDIKPEQFVVIVRDIPSPSDKRISRKEQVDTYFKAIYPDTFYKSLIVTDNKHVNKIWYELETYKRKLYGAETAYSTSKTLNNPEGHRPKHRIGLLGLCGNKVDSIEYYNEKILQLTPKLELEQIKTLKDRQLSSALVFFTSRVVAASAARNLHARMIDTWTVLEAPEPRQLIWSNLNLNYYAREVRKYFVYAIVAISIFFYTFPVYFICALTTAENLVELLPFMKNVVEVSTIRTILQAYLPQIILTIVLYILDKIVLFLSKIEGIPSKSHVVRAASGKYFYFTVFNVFIGVTLGGNITYSILEAHLDQIDDLIGTRFPDASAFFLTFVALKFFVSYGLELSRLVPLIIFHIRRKYLCNNENDVKEAWDDPGDFGYVTRLPNDLLILTITLCYSVVSPLIIPFGVIYFALGWLILRNQALKVYIPSFESYGRMWPHIHTRFLAALFLMQVTMFCYFKVKNFPYFIIIILLPIITLIFAFICHKKFYRFFHHTTLELACCEFRENPNYEEIYRAYLPPSLRSVKLDDDDESQI